MPNQAHNGITQLVARGSFFSVAKTPTAALYGVAHEAATLHDLLEFWSYDYGTYNGSVWEFGFFLQDINGVAGFYDDAGTPSNYADDACAYRQVIVNGEAIEVGISSVAAEGGMIVRFRLEMC